MVADPAVAGSVVGDHDSGDGQSDQGGYGNHDMNRWLIRSDRRSDPQNRF
jgi:hypothetical protein